MSFIVITIGEITKNAFAKYVIIAQITNNLKILCENVNIFLFMY